jgi:hypothetical protein
MVHIHIFPPLFVPVHECDHARDGLRGRYISNVMSDRNCAIVLETSWMYLNEDPLKVGNRWRLNVRVANAPRGNGGGGGGNGVGNGGGNGGNGGNGGGNGVGWLTKIRRIERAASRYLLKQLTNERRSAVLARVPPRVKPMVADPGQWSFEVNAETVCYDGRLRKSSLSRVRRGQFVRAMLNVRSMGMEMRAGAAAAAAGAPSSRPRSVGDVLQLDWHVLELQYNTLEPRECLFRECVVREREAAAAPAAAPAAAAPAAAPAPPPDGGGRASRGAAAETPQEKRERLLRSMGVSQAALRLGGGNLFGQMLGGGKARLRKAEAAVEREKRPRPPPRGGQGIAIDPEVIAATLRSLRPTGARLRI